MGKHEGGEQVGKSLEVLLGPAFGSRGGSSGDYGAVRALLDDGDLDLFRAGCAVGCTNTAAMDGWMGAGGYGDPSLATTMATAVIVGATLESIEVGDLVTASILSCVGGVGYDTMPAANLCDRDLGTSFRTLNVETDTRWAIFTMVEAEVVTAVALVGLQVHDYPKVWTLGGSADASTSSWVELLSYDDDGMTGCAE